MSPKWKKIFAKRNTQLHHCEQQTFDQKLTPPLQDSLGKFSIFFSFLWIDLQIPETREEANSGFFSYTATLWKHCLSLSVSKLHMSWNEMYINPSCKYFAIVHFNQIFILSLKCFLHIHYLYRDPSSIKFKQFLFLP